MAVPTMDYRPASAVDAGPTDPAEPAYARSVSDPGGPDYGHYLTPAQERARFGPTAAQAATAFGTQLENYRSGTSTYHAPTTAVTAPAAVAPNILTVNGLDNLPAKAAKPPAAKNVAKASATKNPPANPLHPTGGAGCLRGHRNRPGRQGGDRRDHRPRRRDERAGRRGPVLRRAR